MSSAPIYHPPLSPAQEIASIDLRAALELTPPNQQQQEKMPAGCSKFLPTAFADGVIINPHNRPYKLELRVMSVRNNEAPSTGELQVKFEFRNIGTDAIQIPWSTDPGVIKEGHDPKHLAWDEGKFYVSLKGLKAGRAVVRNLSKSLFGSKDAAGTQLTLRPSEWITATTRFQLTPRYVVVSPGQNAEQSQLSVWWDWVYRGLDIENAFLPGMLTGPCNVLYSTFRHSYRQENSKFPIFLRPAK